MMTIAGFAPLVRTTGAPVGLAMQRLWLTGQVLPAGARLVVRHVFRSAAKKPVEVVYCFPLPRDAALRSFRIAGESFEAHSELKITEAAIASYEEGIERGALSALARQYGDGLVNLSVGNVRPGETVTVHLEILCGVELNDDGFRFRFPFTLAPTYHSRAKAMLTAAGEGERELPFEQFGDLILPLYREDASALHQTGFDLSIISGLDLEEIGSPSHAVSVRHNGGSARVALGAETDVPNRDLVLDFRFRSPAPQVLAGLTKDGKGHFAAIVPSSAFGTSAETPRRVVILLDRSGSMGGGPIEEARKAIVASLGLLSEADSFGLVAFNQTTATFQPSLVPATRAMREKAGKFLTQVDAGGGTELARGVQAAATLLKGQSGDILILTDGQVSGTEEILQLARATGVRLHCLGIGSASQDRFLALLARATGGVSRFVTPRERVDVAAVDLFASVGRPVASELTCGANIQPEPPSCVFRGTPVLLFGEAGEDLSTRIELTWNSGQSNLPVNFEQTDAGETLWLLQGSRLITDCESQYPGSEALASLEKRQQSRVAAKLLSLSEAYGLACREMSLVSVVTRAGDRPGSIPETSVVPIGMAQDTSFGAYFPGNDPPVMSLAAATRPLSSRVSEKPLARRVRASKMPAEFTGAIRLKDAAEEGLLDLASQMDPDGGMPGESPEARICKTALALLAFLSEGHTPERGAFRLHVVRLVSFLKSRTHPSSDERRVITAVLDLARKNAVPAGDWITMAANPGRHWDEVKKVLLQT